MTMACLLRQDFTVPCTTQQHTPSLSIPGPTSTSHQQGRGRRALKPIPHTDPSSVEPWSDLATTPKGRPLRHSGGEEEGRWNRIGHWRRAGGGKWDFGKRQLNEGGRGVLWLGGGRRARESTGGLPKVTFHRKEQQGF